MGKKIIIPSSTNSNKAENDPDVLSNAKLCFKKNIEGGNLSVYPLILSAYGSMHISTKNSWNKEKGNLSSKSEESVML